MEAAFDRARAAAIGRALGAIPASVYQAEQRPRLARPALLRARDFPSPYDVLTGLALALSNYQLGLGRRGSRQYWQDAADELERRGTIATGADLLDFMRALMQRSSASRFASTKLARVARLLRSPVPAWVAERSMDELGRDCMELWDQLARAMRQTRDSKTVVYAMRIFADMHGIVTGRPVPFPVSVPIIVDLRIGRVSLASGLMVIPDPSDVLQLMEAADQYVAKHKRSILAAWNAVGESASRVSLFRIDGLMWELAEPIYRERSRRAGARGAIADMLRSYGAGETIAGPVAAELTEALPET